MKLLQPVNESKIYGITSDPLTKFALVFSALIHDVDHSGVSNYQLVKEEDPLAVAYGEKSVAEQHSFTLAFELLMNEEYNKLRAAIYQSQEEYDRFQQLCINCVIATDVFDKELKSFREDRWKKAFNANSSETEDLKATIIIEYIIQASDVAHTMQHWLVYKKVCLDSNGLQSGSLLIDVFYCLANICVVFCLNSQNPNPSGTRDSSLRCMQPIRLAELRKILLKGGTMVNCGSLTTTSFHWLRN